MENWQLQLHVPKVPFARAHVLVACCAPDALVKGTLQRIGVRAAEAKSAAAAGYGCTKRRSSGPKLAGRRSGSAYKSLE